MKKQNRIKEICVSILIVLLILITTIVILFAIFDYMNPCKICSEITNTTISVLK